MFRIYYLRIVFIFIFLRNIFPLIVLYEKKIYFCSDLKWMEHEKKHYFFLHFKQTHL